LFDGGVEVRLSNLYEVSLFSMSYTASNFATMTRQKTLNFKFISRIHAFCSKLQAIYLLKIVLKRFFRKNLLKMPLFALSSQW